ncbi:MAG: PilZ domain-containing protein [Pseudomonadota bacterium]
MLDSKVKLKEVRSGREFLLLVVKMNLKGLLVRSPHPVEPNAPLLLSLQLSEDAPSVELRAEVHKTTPYPNGSHGVIVRFLNPPNSALAKIAHYMEEHEIGADGRPLQKPTPPSRERTAINEIASYSKLLARAPEPDGVAVPTPVDEEALHDADPGLAGRTRIFDVPKRGRRRRPRGRRNPFRVGVQWAGLAAILLILGMLFLRPLVRYLDERFGLRPSVLPESFSILPSPEPVIPTPPTPTPTATPPQMSPIPTVVVRAEITRYEIIRSKSFVKLVVHGTGDLSRFTVSRASNPRRLLVELSSVGSFRVPDSVAVGRSPLRRIRTRSAGPGTQIILDLYPVEFPRYQVRPHPGSLDIVLQR